MEQGIWTREFLISPELCGMDGRLGVLGGLTLFQALAAEHAEQIGVGFAAAGVLADRPLPDRTSAPPRPDGHRDRRDVAGGVPRGERPLLPELPSPARR